MAFMFIRCKEMQQQPMFLRSKKMQQQLVRTPAIAWWESGSSSPLGSPEASASSYYSSLLVKPNCYVS